MMGRANLCDAEFCNKAAAGNADDIRPCIGCLRCLNGIMFGKRISYTVNPDVERDEAGKIITPAAVKEHGEARGEKHSSMAPKSRAKTQAPSLCLRMPAM